MANGSLAEYFLKIGVKIDKAELKKIDNLLKDIEKRLKGIGKAQEETDKPKGKRPLSEEQQRLKVAREAAKVAAHQLSLRQKWLKQQDKFAESAKKVHDHQMKLMRQAQGAANAGAKQDVKNVQAVARAVGKNSTAWKQQFKSTMSGMVGKPTSGRLLNERQKMYDNLFGATSKGQPFKNLSASQIRANQKSFFANTRGIEVRSGYNSQYRLGEQRAAGNEKGESERLAAEKAANKKIEEERKKHSDRLARIEQARLRRQAVMDRIYGRVQAQQRLQQQAQQNWLERQRIRQEQMQSRGSRSGASYSRANFLHAGGAAGALARYGAGALPFVGGAYGFMNLNQANQESISARLTTQAVLQAKGYTEQDGKAAFSWLKNLANDVGFNYMDAAPEYNQFLSNSLGAGLNIGASQEIYKGFSEYQTAMGVTPARRKLVQVGLSQMLGKGVVSMQELRQQMSESMPGTIDVFAEALSEMTGSGLTGQEAVAALYEAVGSGKLESAKILPIVARILHERAQPKLGILKKSSIAEQGRMGSQVADLVEKFSAGGGEQAFARFFRTMTNGLKESEPLVRGLTGAFENMVRFMDAPVDLFKDFNRVLEETSRISGVSEKSLTSLALVGVAMATKWGRVAGMFGLIFITLQDLSYGLQGYDSYTKRAMDLLNPQKARDDLKVGLNVPAMGYPKGYTADGWDKRMDAIEDPQSIYYKDPEGYDAFRQDSMNALRENKAYEQSVSFGDVYITLPEGSAEMSSEEKASSFAEFLGQKVNEAFAAFGSK